MRLNVRIEDIPLDGMDLDIEVPVSDFDQEDDISGYDLHPVGPLTGHLRIEPAGRQVLVRGDVRLPLRLSCSRCLEDFDHQAEEELIVLFTPETDDERDEDDTNLETFAGEEFDLWPVIMEHLVLGQPVKPLCREECQGLCPVCGANRNSESCQCNRPQGSTGFSALLNIRDKLPQGA